MSAGSAIDTCCNIYNFDSICKYYDNHNNNHCNNNRSNEHFAVQRAKF